MIPWGRRLSLSSKQIIYIRQVMCSSPTSYCCYFLIYIASRQSSRELLLSNFYFCFAKHYSTVLHQMHVDLKDPDLNTPGSTTHAAPTLTPGRGGDWPPSHSVKLREVMNPRCQNPAVEILQIVGCMKRRGSVLSGSTINLRESTNYYIFKSKSFSI